MKGKNMLHAIRLSSLCLVAFGFAFSGHSEPEPQITSWSNFPAATTELVQSLIDETTKKTVSSVTPSGFWKTQN